MQTILTQKLGAMRLSSIFRTSLFSLSPTLPARQWNSSTTILNLYIFANNEHICYSLRC